MKRHAQIVVLGALISLAASPAARADPLSLTSGFLLVSGFDVTSPPSVLIGDAGFRLVANVIVGGVTQMDPIQHCRWGPDCLPGDRISLGAYLDPPDSLSRAVLQFRGAEYRDWGVDQPHGLALELAGSALLPAFGDFSARTVAAPFLITALVTSPLGVTELLRGRGTATLWISPGPVIDGARGWDVTQLRYDIEDTAPIPEPATMLLLGTGLAALAARRRARPAGALQPDRTP